jgi:hypothetical protein
MILRILRWNIESVAERLRHDHPKGLERRLTDYTDLDRLSIKRLIRQIKDNQCVSITLRKSYDKYAAHHVRTYFESLGAEVQLEESHSTQ